MNILLDANTLQGQAHLEEPEVKGRRLNAFLGILAEIGATRWTPGPLLDPALRDAALLVVPTRIRPFAKEELDAVEAFVGAGGALWLLSNHHPYHEHDAPLARRFGVVLEPTFFHTPKSLTPIEGRFLAGHAILTGPAGPVRSIVTNTTCSLAPSAAAPVAFLPEAMTDRLGGPPPGGRLFGAALDARAGSPDRSGGRVLLLADSGFLGDAGSTVPGTGLVEEGDNRVFIRNAVAWLLAPR